MPVWFAMRGLENEKPQSTGFLSIIAILQNYIKVTVAGGVRNPLSEDNFLAKVEFPLLIED